MRRRAPARQLRSSWAFPPVSSSCRLLRPSGVWWSSAARWFSWPMPPRGSLLVRRSVLAGVLLGEAVPAVARRSSADDDQQSAWTSNVAADRLDRAGRFRGRAGRAGSWMGLAGSARARLIATLRRNARSRGGDANLLLLAALLVAGLHRRCAALGADHEC